MEGENRCLDSEGEGEGRKQQHAGDRRERSALKLQQRERQVSCALRVRKSEVQDAHQKECRSGEGVDEELGGSRSSVSPTPTNDQEVRRDQGQFKEQEEQDQIKAHEGANAGTLEKQHPSGVGLRPLRDGSPKKDQGGHQRRQANDEQADAVDACEPGGPKRGCPGVVRDELIPRIVDVENDPHRNRHAQGGNGGDQ